ncbi:Transposase, IS66 [Vreelandella titanicae BH1]|uniref:Transposase, IS66 n=1 Tax=Vreelandella titanicae BH1 TaxID=1204738 RepID=L9U5N7_9GAMM|nr:Transposase, IS66 [Halomonas titanicae BH1]
MQRGWPPGQQVVLFDYAASRAGRVPVDLLGDYAGRLLTDGYEGYAEVVRRNGITHAGCWEHDRRKFVEAQKVQLKGKTGKADWALNQIRKLYAVEKQAKALAPAVRCVNRRAGHLSISSAPGSTNHWPRYCPKVRWVKPCTTWITSGSA